MSTEKEFINGLYSSDVADSAPAWILGKGSIHVEKLQTWLDTHKNLAGESGLINYTIKRSEKTGKRYIEVDTWKPKKEVTYDEMMAQNHVQPDGSPYPMDANGAVKAIYDEHISHNMKPEDIPL